MSLKFLIAAIIVGFVTAQTVNNVVNKCPQPTASNPSPPAFLYVHPDDCTRFATCSNGVPTVMSCPPKTRFSDEFQTCTWEGSHYDTCTRDNAVRECSRGASLIGHPRMCQRYFNCSGSAGRQASLGPYEAECTYPDLFDILQKKCVPFNQGYCGPFRVAGIGPCEYAQNVCSGPNCQECGSRLGSCVGLPDGFNARTYREGTPYYVRCDTGRTVEFDLYCPMHFTGTQAIFHPTKRQCVSMWEVPNGTGSGQAPTCGGKTNGKYRVDGRDDVYYSCPGAEVSFCRNGTMFNLFSQQCETRL